MAESGGDGECPYAHELSASAERDVREMVLGNELPAQWQKLPLTTVQEMQAGRKALGSEEVRRVTISRWADEGEKWLRQQFEGKNVEFHTAWDTKAGEITLEVYLMHPVTNGDNVCPTPVFTETCRAECFVSTLMVTKIAMVC